MKREENNSVSLEPVPVVLQSVTPQEGEESGREGVVCQLTVAHGDRGTISSLS